MHDFTWHGHLHGSLAWTWTGMEHHHDTSWQDTTWAKTWKFQVALGYHWHGVDAWTCEWWWIACYLLLQERTWWRVCWWEFKALFQCCSNNKAPKTKGVVVGMRGWCRLPIYRRYFRVRLGGDSTETGRALGSRLCVCSPPKSPTVYGYPMLRPRFYCIGVRDYPRSKEDLRDELMNMSNTLKEYLAPGPDFITFLNLESENLSLKYWSQHDMIMWKMLLLSLGFDEAKDFRLVTDAAKLY